jgi:hypothetical protein
MRIIILLSGIAGLIGGAGVVATPRPSVPSPTRTTSAAHAERAAVPFHVGEKMTYEAKVNFLSAGSATMSVEDIEEIRGRPTYHTVFDVRGRVLLFHVNDHYESWFDTTSLVSLHHVQHIDETKNSADRTYGFYPERKVYVRNGVENPSVADPLDEGSFIYFMRSVPLEVGKTYEFNRYYHLDRNPVVIQVERKEHIKVPAGEFDAIVVRPTIKSKGLFSENGQAEVWFSDDSADVTALEIEASVRDTVPRVEAGRVRESEVMQHAAAAHESVLGEVKTSCSSVVSVSVRSLR